MNLTFPITIFALAILSSITHAMTVETDSTQRSVDYVSQLNLDCTLTDGYVCADVKEEDFLTPDSWRRMVPASYIRAWQVAYEDFRQISDLTDEQKDLKHYKVGFTENDSQYIILLLGLAMPYVDEQGKPSGIVSAVFGRSTKYWIDKKSNEIVKRLYYK